MSTVRTRTTRAVHPVAGDGNCFYSASSAALLLRFADLAFKQQQLSENEQAFLSSIDNNRNETIASLLSRYQRTRFQTNSLEQSIANADWANLETKASLALRHFIVDSCQRDANFRRRWRGLVWNKVVIGAFNSATDRNSGTLDLATMRQQLESSLGKDLAGQFMKKFGTCSQSLTRAEVQNHFMKHTFRDVLDQIGNSGHFASDIAALALEQLFDTKVAYRYQGHRTLRYFAPETDVRTDYTIELEFCPIRRGGTFNHYNLYVPQTMAGENMPVARPISADSTSSMASSGSTSNMSTTSTEPEEKQEAPRTPTRPTRPVPATSPDLTPRPAPNRTADPMRTSDDQLGATIERVRPLDLARQLSDASKRQLSGLSEWSMSNVVTFFSGTGATQPTPENISQYTQELSNTGLENIRAEKAAMIELNPDEAKEIEAEYQQIEEDHELTRIQQEDAFRNYIPR